MLIIEDKDIYTEDGDFLKHINCPKNVGRKGLRQQLNGQFSCDQCERSVINTAMLTEIDLIQLLQDDAPNTCLAISPLDRKFLRRSITTRVDHE